MVNQKFEGPTKYVGMVMPVEIWEACSIIAEARTKTEKDTRKHPKKWSVSDVMREFITQGATVYLAESLGVSEL